MLIRLILENNDMNDFIKINIPVANGTNLQLVMPPSLIYWPRETSRKKIGIPPKTRKMAYGIRNAPKIKHNTKQK